MKNTGSVKMILFVISFFFPLITGCGKLNTSAKATATAQTIRYQQLATQMSTRYLATLQASERQATATAVSARTTFETANTWKIFFDDSFLDNRHSWPIGTDSGDLTDLTIELSNGVIRVDALAKESFTYWFYPDGSQVADFALTVEGRQTTSSADGSYGVLFHLEDSDNYSTFLIHEDGYYTLETWVDGEWSAPINWTMTPLIQLGETNRIDVVAKGNYLSFYVNNEWVTDYYDSQQSEGITGLIVGLYEPGAQASFEFEKFILRSP